MPNPELDKALDQMGYAPVPGEVPAAPQVGNPDFDRELDALGFAPVAEVQAQMPDREQEQIREAGSAIINAVPEELPDLSALPNMDKIAEQAQRQSDAEDSYFSRGKYSPSAGEIVDMQVKTAQTSAGLTGSNNPRTTVRLGGPQ